MKIAGTPAFDQSQVALRNRNPAKINASELVDASEYPDVLFTHESDRHIFSVGKSYSAGNFSSNK